MRLNTKNVFLCLILQVFDVSARENDNPSLNICLTKVINLVGLFPSDQMRFQQSYFVVTSDIKRAIKILNDIKMASGCERLSLIFMDYLNVEKIYSHRVVVFGVTSSPVLLLGYQELRYRASFREDQEKVSPGNYSQGTLPRLTRVFMWITVSPVFPMNTF